jgi:hypothetical protein
VGQQEIGDGKDGKRMREGVRRARLRFTDTWEFERFLDLHVHPYPTRVNPNAESRIPSTEEEWEMGQNAESSLKMS